MIRKFSKLFIIDGSYLIHRSLKQPDMEDFCNKAGEKTNGIYGFLRSLNKEFQKLDSAVVVTWDSGLSPRRVAVYNKYKRNDERVRDKILRETSNRQEADERCNQLKLESDTIESIRDSIAEVMRNPDYKLEYQKDNPDDYVMQYHRQRDILINILNSLGVPSIKIKGWEGYDLITLLTRMSEKAVIMTDDKDMLQLLSPNVDILRPLHKDYLTLSTYLEKEGFDDIRESAIVKAIVGDGSDNIPSVTEDCERKYSLGGTRAKTVAKIILKHNEKANDYLAELVDMNKNYYRGFISHHDNYIRNMKLVDLSLVENDEDVMERMANEIIIRVGKCNMMESVKLISEQSINTFDVNGFISHMLLVSTKLSYK